MSTWGLLSAAIKHISWDVGWGGFRNKCAMQRKYFEFPKKPAGRVPSIQDSSRKAMARSLQTGALCEESSRTCCCPPPVPVRPFLCSASSVLDIPAMKAERARSPAICKDVGVPSAKSRSLSFQTLSRGEPIFTQCLKDARNDGFDNRGCLVFEATSPSSSPGR